MGGPSPSAVVKIHFFPIGRVSLKSVGNIKGCVFTGLIAGKNLRRTVGKGEPQQVGGAYRILSVGHLISGLSDLDGQDILPLKIAKVLRQAMDRMEPGAFRGERLFRNRNPIEIDITPVVFHRIKRGRGYIRFRRLGPAYRGCHKAEEHQEENLQPVDSKIFHRSIR